ncbi:MAG: DUF4838 domain-containing protein [Lentisphaerae bacterium]|jgi:GH43 family beta-xylosidase|nr:DUF4838 domain-containing protein [Lentisphaerota bacterium]
MFKRNFILTLVLCATSAAFAFDIARDGKAVAVIATGAKPSASTLGAAEELAKYLGKMCGGTFEILQEAPPEGRPCIYVGGPCEDVGFDGLCLRVEKDKNRLLLTGHQPRGPVYAVYELLERLGCGFWADDNETVPEMKDISVADDLNFTDRPVLRLRGNSGTTAVYNPGWCPKARLNGNGGTPARLGGSYFVDFSESSVGLNGYNELAKECFALHPEWYSLVRNKNTGKMERTPEQLCFTNPEVLEKLVELARARLEKNPDLEFIGCSYADVAPPCSCPQCSALAGREGSKAAILLNGVNYIARDLADDYPNVTVTFLAYGMSSIIPPKNLKLEPNVACVFANLARNYAKPPPRDGLLKRWCELTNGKVYIWGYGAMFHNYIMPTPTVDLIGEEMRVYRDLGCLGVSSQLSQDQLSDCIDLLCWLFGKMAWNPDYDEWALIDKWCDGALGAGSPYLKKWLRMERDYRPNIRYLGPYEKDNRVCLSPELLLEGNRLFLEALDAVKDDKRATRQLEQMYGSIVSVMVQRYNFDIAATAKGIAATNEAAAKALRILPLPSREDYYQQLAHFCRKYRAGWFGEGQGSILNRTHHGEILRVNGKPPPWTFQNPISETPVQDPFVTFDKESGYYYFLCTPAYGDQIEIRRGRVANKLVNTEAAGDRCIAWRPPKKKGDAPIVGNITAPELHKGTDGKWYIYASGSDGITLSTGGNKALDAELGDMGGMIDLMDGGASTSLKSDRGFTDMIEASENRLFVLQSKGDDPFGGFEFKGILDKTISALDPTIFTGHDGVLYMAYARQIAGTQIELRKMKDYLSFDPDVKPIPVVTANSTSDIFEAPAFIQKDGRTFLIYSCNGRWSNSGKMMIRELAGTDVLRNSSWGGRRGAKDFLVPGNRINSRTEERDRRAQIHGPGHASFFSSPDGSEIWCAYHAMFRPNVGTGPADTYCYQQRVDYEDDGAPIMGQGEVAGSTTGNRIEGASTFFIVPMGEKWEEPPAKKKDTPAPAPAAEEPAAEE